MNLVAALRRGTLDLLAMLRLCLLPFAFLTVCNLVLLSAQGLEIMHALVDSESIWKPIAVIVVFGVTCGFTILLLILRPRTYTFPDRTAVDEPWPNLLRYLLPSCGFALAVLPALTWLTVLSFELQEAGTNAIRLAGVGVIAVSFAIAKLRSRSGLMAATIWLGTSLMMPIVVLKSVAPSARAVGVALGLSYVSSISLLVTNYTFWAAALLLSCILTSLRRVENRASLPSIHSGQLGRQRQYLLLLLALFYVAAFCLFSFKPATTARSVGPLGTMMLGFGFWTLLLGLIFVYLPRKAGLPSLSILIVALFVISSSSNNNHAVRQKVAAGQAELSPQDLPEYMKGWLNSRDVHPGERFPVFLVAAEGGGIRAAYWTASVLASLDDSTGGRFNHHLFAISSVSGGSFGAALYAAALADKKDGHLPHAQGVSETVKAVAANDYLSPLIAGALFTDFAQRLLPGVLFENDRAAIFEHSWEETWYSVVGTHRFEEPLSKLYETSGKRDQRYLTPALFINATEVNTGRKFLISNIRVSHAEFPETYLTHEITQKTFEFSDVPLSAAAHLSARFPFLSPAATIAGKPSDTLNHLMDLQRFKAPSGNVPWGSVVDGGYLENSGSGTASQLLRALRFYEPLIMPDLRLDPKFADVHLDYYVLIISNDPDAASTRSHTFNGDVSETWYQTYSPAEFDAELERRGRGGLPDRPLEPLPDILNRHFRAALNLRKQLDFAKLLRPSDSLSEVTSPLSAVLNARTARADAAKTELASLANDPPEGFLESRCCERELVALSQKFGELNPCRLAPRAFEVSLGKAISSTQHPRDDVPPLGWYLRGRSRSQMEEAVKAIADQGEEAIVQNVILPYVKGIGNPRSTCEVSLLTTSFTKDKGIRRYMELKHPPHVPREREPLPEVPCNQVNGQGALDLQLLFAAINGSLNQALCLLRNGANASAMDDSGNTALSFAVEKGAEKLGLALLKKGADFKASDAHHVPLLIVAIESGQSSLARELIRRGADVNARSGNGGTALMAAAKTCSVEIGKTLVQKGADATAKDMRGETVDELANKRPCRGWSGAVASVHPKAH